MLNERTAKIAGAALVAAIGGRLTYQALEPFVRTNYAAARAAASSYVKEAIGYESKKEAGTLPDTVTSISRGARWRAVDFVINELISAPGSKWATLPGERIPGGLPYAQVQERSTDIPGIYLQRISYYSGLNHSLAEALKMSTLIDRMTLKSQTFLVGEKQIYLPPALLRKISLGEQEPGQQVPPYHKL